ncbi:MAG TPA: 30S ribosome-binding factor RbfA [Saprospiraceae bacterium]|nr:30S ribosome-binding factor RbfA [Saprospiraceae bacterium]HMP25043.1 30S ribosome-binding factor RbfA [Saprospiraceae bacterium]
METKRQKQVGELIKRHFSMVLQAEGSYIYGAQVLVTVTNVKMTPDFSLAKIYLSVFNTDNKQATILEMEDQQVRLRQSLAARIRKHVRRIPEIAFYLDDTLDEMYRISAMFEELHKNNQMGDDVDAESDTKP